MYFTTIENHSSSISYRKLPLTAPIALPQFRYFFCAANCTRPLLSAPQYCTGVLVCLPPVWGPLRQGWCLPHPCISPDPVPQPDTQTPRNYLYPRVPHEYLLRKPSVDRSIGVEGNSPPGQPSVSTTAPSILPNLRWPSTRHPPFHSPILVTKDLIRALSEILLKSFPGGWFLHQHSC